MKDGRTRGEIIGCGRGKRNYGVVGETVRGVSGRYYVYFVGWLFM